MTRSLQFRSVLAVAVIALCAQFSFARTASPAVGSSNMQAAAAYPINPMPHIPPPPPTMAAYPINPMPPIPPHPTMAAYPINPMPPIPPPPPTV